MQIHLLGLGTTGAALLFSLAFARLAAGFDSPDRLRRPAEEVLARFGASGPGSIPAIGTDGSLSGLAATTGFLGFSGWLVLAGVGLMRRPVP